MPEKRLPNVRMFSVCICQAARRSDLSRKLSLSGTFAYFKKRRTGFSPGKELTPFSGQARSRKKTVQGEPLRGASATGMGVYESSAEKSRRFPGIVFHVASRLWKACEYVQSPQK
jgi:hypothetical protein